MHESKIVGADDMARRAFEARRRGEKVVFTNGCFDLLHLGHVLYLAQARSLGSHLLVGVNSDDSARALKGPSRPFNSEWDRAAVLAALEDVTLVTIFGEGTAESLVELVKPDIYVKGGDYAADPASPAFPVEGRMVARYGGEVRIIPFATGYSTTTLIERIRACAAP